MDAVKIIAEADSVTFLTGAGISTSSGIPDFRSPDGLWTKDPRNELISDLACYLSDDDIRALNWQFRVAPGFWSAEPTRAHRASAACDPTRAVVTQNTDSLHQLAGSTSAVEVHGNARRWRCEDCRTTGDMPELIASGPSLTVQPVASLVGWRRGHRAQVVIVNAEQTPWGDRAHVVLGELAIEPPRLLGVDT